MKHSNSQKSTQYNIFGCIYLNYFFLHIKVDQNERYYFSYSSQPGVSGESRIDFGTQCVIMTLVGRWDRQFITKDILEFRKSIEFERWCIAVCFSYTFLFIDG